MPAAVRVNNESPNTYEDINKVIKDTFAEAQINTKETFNKLLKHSYRIYK